MSKPSRWIKKEIKNGVWEIELSSWKWFHDFIRQEMLEYSHYIWRGQRDSGWRLESSLDRLIKFKPKSEREYLANEHLGKFKLAIRGRRGSNPSKIADENEWWALGQHQGLATPLLDWTESPFVALYFAFEKQMKSSTGKRAVWAIGGIDGKNNEIISTHKKEEFNRPLILEFVRPHQDENARLVSQAGLFSRTPIGDTVETWIERNYIGESHKAPLLKLVFPEKERTECLRTLNKMNINHLTLFPDTYGASQHCNKALQIAKY